MAVSENIIATIAFPAEAITDTLFASTAGKELSAAKQYHLIKVQHDFNLPTTGMVPLGVTSGVFLHHARGAGTVNKVWGLLYVDGSSTSVNLRVCKNGATILSSDIALTHLIGNAVEVTATVSDTTYVAGDNFIASINNLGATGASGPVVGLEVIEKLSS